MARKDNVLRRPLAAFAALAVASCGRPPTSRVFDEFSGSEFYYYDHEDRSEIVASVGQAVQAKYALLPLKEQRLGLDAHRLFAEQVAAENTVADVNTPFEQARSNLSFLDRVRRLVATFKDSHFSAKPQNRTPTVLNGLALTEANGNVVIASMHPALLRLAAERSGNADFVRLTPGDKIISIDGQPIEDEIAALLPFVHASSSAFARGCAIEQLTQRSYAYPYRPYADYVIERRADGRMLNLRLPYYFDDGRFRRTRLFISQR